MIGSEIANFGAAIRDFRRARRQAAMEQILARLSGETADLLSYEDVRKKLKPRESGKRKLEDVPLDAIVGSVGRYSDFTRSFLPKRDSTQERWARIKVATVSPTSGGLPPIELYKVGDAYFVVDGHHRVSVARELGSSHIEAYVTEVATKVPVSPDDSPDDLILKAEYTEFLKQTNVDSLRPDANLTLTAPGKYRLLKEHIDVHRYFMGIEQDREISYDEAVTHWYDTVYLPIVRIIRERDLLRDFPGRTEADLYLWIMEHRAALQEALGWEIRPETAATDLVDQFSRQPKHLVRRVQRRLLDAVTPEEFDAGPPPGTWRVDHLPTHREDRLFTDVLVGINGEDNGWHALDQAIVLARHEGSRIKGLHVVPSEEQAQSEAAQAVHDEFQRRIAEAGVAGRLAFAVGTVSHEICERARWADLVMLGLAHPPEPRPLGRLGSGIRTILRRCPTPVLTVPYGYPIAELRRALIAYDASPKAQEALFVATYVACAWHVDLTVLAVRETVKGHVDEILDPVRDYLAEREVEADFVVGDGAVGETILRTANERNVDLLLMGGYKASPVVEIMLGSTVEYMLHASPYPILLCH